MHSFYQCANLCKSLTGATALSAFPKACTTIDQDLKAPSIDPKALTVIVRDEDHLKSAVSIQGKHQVRDEGWIMDPISSYTRSQQK